MEQMRERRKELGLTQTQVAQMVGGTYHQIMRLETGALKPENITLWRAAAIAKVLQVSIDTFAEWAGLK